MEPLPVAARRELAEETGLELPTGSEPLMVGTFGDPGRDPRGWTVAAAFVIDLGAASIPEVLGGDDAAEAGWHRLAELPDLAFDHDVIVTAALRRIALEA